MIKRCLHFSLAVFFCLWLLPISCFVSKAHHQHDELAHALCLFHDAMPQGLVKAKNEAPALTADSGHTTQRVPGGTASSELSSVAVFVLNTPLLAAPLFKQSFTYALLQGDPSEHVPKA